LYSFYCLVFQVICTHITSIRHSVKVNKGLKKWGWKRERGWNRNKKKNCLFNFVQLQFWIFFLFSSFILNPLCSECKLQKKREKRTSWSLFSNCIKCIVKYFEYTFTYILPPFNVCHLIKLNLSLCGMLELKFNVIIFLNSLSSARFFHFFSSVELCTEMKIAFSFRIIYETCKKKHNWESRKMQFSFSFYPFLWKVSLSAISDISVFTLLRE
jgi:hypothetical protein